MTAVETSQLATSCPPEPSIALSRAWLTEFEQRNGRPLRVLHIGNIANNAYNNAKIQRARGIDADVLSFDYYHIMATPEWEDAPFIGDPGDDYFPDWWSVELKGFRRPDWFVAGPLDPAIRYLLAKTSGSRATPWLWRWLSFERWILCRRSRLARIVKAVITAICGHAVAYPMTPASGLLLTRIGTACESMAGRSLLERTGAGRALARWGARMRRFGRTANLGADQTRHLRLAHRNLADIRTRAARLFAEIGRDNPPVEMDWFYRWWWHPYMSLLLRRYDVVQGYATYTALPFIAGRIPYAAYEHGTIRSIPFQPTGEGRMCMATYRGAAHVFVTNLDNLASAAAMGIDAARVTALPHAFDSGKLFRFATDNAAVVPPLEGPVVLLGPARQHWVDQNPGWAKGNDRLFSALRLVKDAGQTCLLRAVAWGNDLEDSRRRIAELGIGEMVEWVPVMSKRDLWTAYLGSHAVVDQFLVAGFSGVTFETMALGRRLLTHLDTALAATFFGEAPPLHCCSEPEQIATALLDIIADRNDCRRIGSANRTWIERYHSADRIVGLQVEAYAQLVREHTGKL